jgi:hypothetical protein
MNPHIPKENPVSSSAGKPLIYSIVVHSGAELAINGIHFDTQ